MIGHGSKFGRNKEQAIAALLLHRSFEEAAKAAGISTATLKRWKQLPEFKAAYLEARKELVFRPMPACSKIVARPSRSCSN